MRDGSNSPVMIMINELTQKIINSLPEDKEFQYTYYSDNYRGDRKLARVDILKFIRNALEDNGVNVDSIDLDAVVDAALDKYMKHAPSTKELIDKALANDNTRRKD